MKSIYLTCLFSVLFFCIPFFVKANMDMEVYHDAKNVHLQYYLFDEEFETNNKGKILLELAQKLIEKSDNPNLQVSILINSFAGHQESYYTLGYETFKAWKMGDLGDKEYKGLVIHIKDNDIYIEKILNILANALDKVDYIKSNQSTIYKEAKHSPSNNPKFDTLFSIIEKEVNQYASNPNQLVKSVSNEKLYVKEYSELDYYYQNFKFHIYTTRNYSNKDAEAIYPKEKDLLLVDNLLEIIGNYKNGYLIFTTDSTFYYLTLNNGKVKGEFNIDGIRAGRPPIYKYQHKSEPMNLFIMRISDYDTLHQVLFLPDSNLIIPNYVYDPFSKKNLNLAIKNQREKEVKEKLKNSFTFDFKIAFYISLVIISVLFILLWQQKRK